MIKILCFLFLIRFRRLVSKDDFFSIISLVLLYASSAIVFYINYNELYYYIYLFFIDISVQHINRNDIELLKLRINYKSILFIEYVIYLLPFIIVFLIKMEYLLFLGFLIFIVICQVS